MKIAKLFHNPQAGSGDHTIEELTSLMVSAGYQCTAAPVKRIKAMGSLNGTDLVALAGGDGTVRKAARFLMNKRIPIGLLPKGTANNIATTLAIDENEEAVIYTWNQGNIKQFDVGRIHGLDDTSYFLEGLGFGVFPKLMKEMKHQDKERVGNPEKKLRSAIELLSEIVKKYKARKCTIVADGITYSGKFLLAEVMNIRSIGPNLFLAPLADPGDGKFEIVLIPEEQRAKFLDYLHTKVSGQERTTFFETIHGSNITISWDGRRAHVDDKRVKIKKGQQLSIQLQPHALQFLVPD